MNLTVSDPGLHSAPALLQHVRPGNSRTKAMALLDDLPVRFRPRRILTDEVLICHQVIRDLFLVDTPLPHPTAVSRLE